MNERMRIQRKREKTTALPPSNNEPLQRSPQTVDEVPPVVQDVLSSSGQPLDANAQDFMEARFGHDFSKVRVHTDERAVESAQAVNALAYTVGNDVVFDGGEYMPETETGRHLELIRKPRECDKLRENQERSRCQERARGKSVINCGNR